MVQLEFYNLIPAGPDYPGSFVMTLKDIKSDNVIQMLIGFIDAQIIALELESINPLTPLTHDLLKTILDSFGSGVEHIKILNAEKGIFHAEVKLLNLSNSVKCRPSDGVILSLKYKTPIFIEDTIMSEIGYPMRGGSGQPDNIEEPTVPPAEFKKKPTKAVEVNEDYYDKKLVDAKDDKSFGDIKREFIDFLNKKLMISVQEERYEDAEIAKKKKEILKNLVFKKPKKIRKNDKI